MEIKTLERIDLFSVANTFNESFSDYSINISYSAENFERKVIAENIRLEYSVGAFVNGRLVAFILNGVDQVNSHKCVFNGGTGVVPDYRGQRIVEKMYRYILPRLKEQGYRHHQLEVVDGNIKAERAYEKVGFTRSRTVTGYRGVVGDSANNDSIVLKKVNTIDWDTASTFCDVEPTWQNNINSIKRSLDDHLLIAGFINDDFAGYAAFARSTGRLKQFGVKKQYRRRGIGSALFSYISKTVGEVNFTNYDESDTGALAFFKAMGLTPSYVLYEMRLFF